MQSKKVMVLSGDLRLGTVLRGVTHRRIRRRAVTRGTGFSVKEP